MMASKGLSSSFEDEQGTNNSSPPWGGGITAGYEISHRVLDFDRFFMKTKQQKMDIRFGTQNIRSLYNES
jgi:hypothetical protein